MLASRQSWCSASLLIGMKPNAPPLAATRCFSASGRAKKALASSALPSSAVVVTVNEIYTQCGRAVLRAKLWDPEHHIDPADIPTAGDILKERSEGAFDAETYDREWAGRAKKTMW